MMGDAVALTVYEIYKSIQGESTRAGLPCTFVRLAACDLRCTWCDTPYAFTGGRKMTIDEVVAAVEVLGCRLVELTGGEPLLQAEAPALMATLIDRGYTVLLETGGHLSIANVPEPVVAIVDVKCPGSGEAHRMHWPNLDDLSAHDEVKFVLADRADFDYACDVVTRHSLASRTAAVLFSPVHGILAPHELARWILDAGIPARLQIQTHKYIWEPDARGV
jgi:7-carboxy-7-deazaguanine synthase